MTVPATPESVSPHRFERRLVLHVDGDIVFLGEVFHKLSKVHSIAFGCVWTECPLVEKVGKEVADYGKSFILAHWSARGSHDCFNGVIGKNGFGWVHVSYGLGVVCSDSGTACSIC